MEVARAIATHAAALTEWQAQIGRVSGAARPALRELSAAWESVDTLHRRVEDASHLLGAKRAEQERLRQGTLRASRELKKVETWSESLLDVSRRAEDRTGYATDEHAARRLEPESCRTGT
jgi:hypothetical protein